MAPMVGRVSFLSGKIKEVYETLTKYKSKWGEREIVLDQLDPSIYRNLVSRNWVSLCDVFDPSLATLIREFYSNFSIYHKDTSGHYLTTWIRGKEFRITKHVVFETLGVPLVLNPHILTLSFLQ